MPTIPYIRAEGTGPITTPPLSAKALGSLVLAAAGVEHREERTTVPVHPVLLRALRRANFERCDEGDRLSPDQLSALMSQASSVSERIELKQLIGEAELWPKAGG
jgi:hypothetical protein